MIQSLASGVNGRTSNNGAHQEIPTTKRPRRRKKNSPEVSSLSLADSAILLSELDNARRQMDAIADAVATPDYALAQRLAGELKEDLALASDVEREKVLAEIKHWLIKFESGLQSLLCTLLGLPRVEPLGKDSDVTDAANARRFAFRYSGKVRYVPGWGWMVYGGQRAIVNKETGEYGDEFGFRWRRDDTGEVMRYAKETSRSIYEEARTAPTDDDTKRLAGWAKSSLSKSKLEDMLHLAKSEPGIAARAQDFDQNRWLYNVNNGTLDLRAGKLIPHSPDNLITKLSPIDYEPGAKAELFLKFLRTIFDNNDQTIYYVKRAIGYTLTGDTGEQCLFLNNGIGANGKSTLHEILRQILGDYGQQADFATFLTRSNDSGPRNDIARMAGARFVSAIEMSDGGKLNESVVKQMTGSDTLIARFLHQEFFEFRPQFKVWLAANHKPQITDTGHAMWRRVRLIPFNVTIPEASRDKHLIEKLATELPGILAWAVQGCLDWQREGLEMPEVVRTATEDYREEMDTLGEFISSCCFVGEDASVKATSFLEAYQAHTNSTISGKRLNARMRERGFDKPKHTNKGAIWVGVGLLDLPNSDE